MRVEKEDQVFSEIVQDFWGLLWSLLSHTASVRSLHAHRYLLPSRGGGTGFLQKACLERWRGMQGCLLHS